MSAANQPSAGALSAAQAIFFSRNIESNNGGTAEDAVNRFAALIESETHASELEAALRDTLRQIQAPGNPDENGNEMPNDIDPSFIQAVLARLIAASKPGVGK